MLMTDRSWSVRGLNGQTLRYLGYGQRNHKVILNYFTLLRIRGVSCFSGQGLLR